MTRDNLVTVGKMTIAEWEKSSQRVRASKRTAKLSESRLQEREAILAYYREEDEAVDIGDNIESDMLGETQGLWGPR
ncbi:hypothetical protein Landi51_10491 [Colletotrichum acutatum]